MQCGNLFERLGAADLDSGHHLCAGPHHDLRFGAIGASARQQVMVFWPYPLGVAMHGSRKNKNLRSASVKRFSWIPPLRSRIVCLPSSKACTAALHSFSAVVTQRDYVRGATSTGQLALCINA